MSAEDVNNGLPEPTSTPPMPPLHPAFAVTLNALQDIANERGRQMKDEGYTREHDDGHTGADLAAAAACYAITAAIPDDEKQSPGPFVVVWPWDAASFKPKDRRRDLIRAAALLVAEIERLDRATT